MGGVVLHTNYDSSRAPEGRHTLYCNVLVPIDLKEGGAARWDQLKEARADWIMERLRTYCPNVTGDNLLARVVYSPLDMQRHSPPFQRGDIMGPGSDTISLWDSTQADLSRYRVPGPRAYLLGPFMHPGGGLTGGGRAIAIEPWKTSASSTRV